MKKYVHVGQMKSGTTFIQNACNANRSKLFEKGVFYPGPGFNHQHACYGICGEKIPWIKTVKPSWENLGKNLITKINQQEKDILISCEALSCLDEKGVNDFVEKIGGVDEVIITVRNFHSTLLSAWQQSVKGGGVNSLIEFLDRLQSTRLHNDGLWRNYGFGSTTQNWAEHANVTVLVSNGNEVLDDFFDLLDVSGINYESNNAKSGNKSLMLEDVELLRYMNKINKGLDKDVKEKYVRYLLDEFLFPAANEGQGNKIKLPKSYVESVKLWGDEELDKVDNTSKAKIKGDRHIITKIIDEKLSESDFINPKKPFDRLRFHLEKSDEKSIF